MKEQWPALKELPAETCQTVARLVGEEFRKFFDRGPDPIPTHLNRAAHLAARAALPDCMQRRRHDSLHFTYVRFAGLDADLDDETWDEIGNDEVGAGDVARLGLPKIGWVHYVAEPALRFLFEGRRVRIKGARVWRTEGTWRATISFERLKKPKPAPDPGKVQDDAGRALDLVYRLARKRFGPDFDKYFGPHKGYITADEVDALLRSRGFDLTTRGLRKLLREAGLNPRQLWVSGRNVQGYVEWHIISAWLDRQGLDWFAFYEPGDP